MKFLLLILVSVVSVHAMALDMCEYSNGKEEAQFIGKVINHKPLNQDWSVCSFQVDFTRYDESGICPLDEFAARSATFRDFGCNYENGEVVSGYLVRKKGRSEVEWNGHY